jgi:hypothetical protein
MAQLALLKIFRRRLLGEAEPIDPARVAELIQDVHESDLHEFLFDVTVKGNLALMHALQEHRGPLVLNYESQPDGRASTLNGRLFNNLRSGTLGNCTTVAELKALFSSIKAQGFTGLVEPGQSTPYLFQATDWGDALRIVLAETFQGELPFLDAGLLKSPELAINLSDEASSSATPEAFMPMLCWATPSMVKEFSECLKPVRLLQSVEYEVRPPAAERSARDEYGIEKTPATAFKALAKPADETLVNVITLGIEEGHDQSNLMGNLNHYMGTPLTRSGFSDPAGRVLCETRVDFLIGFPADLCAEQNMLESKRFAAAYFPLDILAMQTLQTCLSDYGYTSPHLLDAKGPASFAYEHPFSQLFEGLSVDHPVHERMRDLLTPEQWVGMARQGGSFTLSVKSLIALRDSFGMDNQGIAINLEVEDIDTLSKAGYRFVDKTLKFQGYGDMSAFYESDKPVTCVNLELSARSIGFVLKDQSSPKILPEAVRLHGLAQSMNLWTCDKPKPETVKQALREILNVNITNPSHQQAMALYAFLVDKGVAACAKEATSPEEWVMIVEIFSERDVEPYLSIMPREAKGRALESQLGL